MKQYSPSGTRLLFFLSTALCISLVSACASRGPVLTGTASQYHPARLASGVPARPGSVAWSPDGRLIAWTGKQLALYDRDSGKQTLFPVANPHFLAWSPDGLLYILNRDARGDVFLSSLDIRSSRVAVLVCVEADAVYPVPDGKSLVLLSAAVTRLSMGSQIDTRLMVYDTGTHKVRTIYHQSRTAMTRSPDAALWTAWLHAGVNPLDYSLFVMEHVTPPLVAGYTEVNTMDIATGDLTPVTGAGSRKQYLSASWSPDGKRLAVTDGNGFLEIRGRAGDSVLLNSSVSGMYPSWNPAGSRIYAGGFLVDSAGTNREQILSGAGAARSIAAWSPDGTMLAVDTDDGLLLFRGIPAAFLPPDGPLDKELVERFSLLRSLALEGAITRDEYRQRRNRLMGTTGDGR